MTLNMTRLLRPILSSTLPKRAEAPRLTHDAVFPKLQQVSSVAVQRLARYAVCFEERFGSAATLALLCSTLLVAGCQTSHGSEQGGSKREATITTGPIQTIVRPSLAARAQSHTPLHPAIPESAVTTVDPAARAAVAQAYQAMENKQWDRLPTLAYVARRDPVLGAYPMYWYLRHHLTTVRRADAIDEAALSAFIEAQQGHYMAQRLKAEWAIVAARYGDFKTAARLGPITVNSTQGRCAVLHGRAVIGAKIGTQEALETFSPATACWPMLSTLYQKGVVGFDDLQSAFRAAVEYDNKSTARHYASIVFNANELGQYDAILQDPQAWIAQQSGPASNRMQAELRAIAFSRLARQDRDKGIEILHRTTLLTPADKQWAYTQFGLVSVLNLEDRADQWYRLGEAVPLSDYNAAWRVRAALRQPTVDWQRVKATIEMMQADQQQQTAWVYWYARALEALGHQAEAQVGYRSLLDDYDFYGQLAREALAIPIQWPDQAAPVSEAELAKVRRNSSLQRALALLEIGAHAYAVVEWNYGIQGMSDRELLAAAELALNASFYDRTINTSLMTQHELNFKQRFVAPYDGRLTAQARRVGVSPAWVYGLIRQESRFVPVARSQVGAFGLMQLMPDTARLVARQLGVQNYHPSMINDFDTNTLFGTTYLKGILDQHEGSEVLATAGYNAGPNRAVRWRNSLSRPVEGAMFVETIPFTETRLYVKHVLSNAVWYEIGFNRGRPASLLKRLGTIAPRP